MKISCPCGRSVDVEPERQEICGRCNKPVFGPGFDPQKYYGPKLGDAFSFLREPNHWDYLLGGGLVLFGSALTLVAFGVPIVAGPAGCLAPIPGMLIFRGGIKTLRQDHPGPRAALIGLLLIVLPLTVLAVVLASRQEVESLAATLVLLAPPGGALATVIAYLRHPLVRYRFGQIDLEELKRRYGEHGFNMLFHKLTLEAHEDDEVSTDP